MNDGIFESNCPNNEDDRSAALNHILQAWENATEEGIDARCNCTRCIVYRTN